MGFCSFFGLKQSSYFELYLILACHCFKFPLLEFAVSYKCTKNKKPKNTCAVDYLVLVFFGQNSKSRPLMGYLIHLSIQTIYIYTHTRKHLSVWTVEPGLVKKPPFHPPTKGCQPPFFCSKGGQVAMETPNMEIVPSS